MQHPPPNAGPVPPREFTARKNQSQKSRRLAQRKVRFQATPTAPQRSPAPPVQPHSPNRDYPPNPQNRDSPKKSNPTIRNASNPTKANTKRRKPSDWQAARASAHKIPTRSVIKRSISQISQAIFGSGPAIFNHQFALAGRVSQKIQQPTHDEPSQAKTIRRHKWPKSKATSTPESQPEPSCRQNLAISGTSKSRISEISFLS